MDNRPDISENPYAAPPIVLLAILAISIIGAILAG